MDKKFLAVVAVALGCMTAAGVGSYLAVRERAGSTPVAEAAVPGAQALAPAVAETEAPLSGESASGAEAEDLAAPEASTGTVGGPSERAGEPAGQVNPAAAPARRKPVSTASGSSRTAARPPAAPGTSSRTPRATRSEPAAAPASASTAASGPARAYEATDASAGRVARSGEPSEAAGAVDTRDSVPAPRQPLEAPVPPAPPESVYEELVVPADAVIGLQVDSTISTERARVEDPVSARTTRDVRVGGRVAIPAGSRVHGTVTLVERGGKIRDRARLGVRFHTLVLADGTRVPLATETLYREGDSVGKSSAAKIGGGAVGGAIIGAILGGGKGAAIGAATGAGGGTAAAMAGDRKPATLPAGSSVTVRLNAPVTITVEQTGGDPRDR